MNHLAHIFLVVRYVRDLELRAQVAERDELVSDGEVLDLEAPLHGTFQAVDHCAAGAHSFHADRYLLHLLILNVDWSDLPIPALLWCLGSRRLNIRLGDATLAELLRYRFPAAINSSREEAPPLGPSITCRKVWGGQSEDSVEFAHQWRVYLGLRGLPGKRDHLVVLTPNQLEYFAEMLFLVAKDREESVAIKDRQD